MAQLPLPDPIAFQQDGPFYDMVTAFVIAIAGLESVLRTDNPMKFKAGEVITLEGKVHPEIRLQPYLIHKLATDGKISSPHAVHSLANMLLNTAYEAVKDKNDRSPEFEFFRHIRNSCSHRNMFNFFPNEPIRPAAWRGRAIDHNRKGSSNPLFGTACFGVYLAAADAVVLLWDIERKF
jgi:hypothetical protein